MRINEIHKIFPTINAVHSNCSRSGNFTQLNWKIDILLNDQSTNLKIFQLIVSFSWQLFMFLLFISYGISNIKPVISYTIGTNCWICSIEHCTLWKILKMFSFRMTCFTCSWHASCLAEKVCRRQFELIPKINLFNK